MNQAGGNSVKVIWNSILFIEGFYLYHSLFTFWLSSNLTFYNCQLHVNYSSEEIPMKGKPNSIYSAKGKPLYQPSLRANIPKYHL